MKQIKPLTITNFANIRQNKRSIDSEVCIVKLHVIIELKIFLISWIIIYLRTFYIHIIKFFCVRLLITYFPNRTLITIILKSTILSLAIYKCRKFGPITDYTSNMYANVWEDIQYTQLSYALLQKVLMNTWPSLIKFIVLIKQAINGYSWFSVKIPTMWGFIMKRRHRQLSLTW